jgi:hypothetical protein
MTFNYNYLLRGFNAELFNDGHIDTTEFIFPITNEIIEKKQEVFHVLFNSKHRFCFYIPRQLTQSDLKYLNAEAIQNVLRLLFLPNYIRVNQQYIFFIEEASDKDQNFAIAKNDLFNEFKKHGANDIIVEALRSKCSSEGTSDEKTISLFDCELNNYLNRSGGDECFEALIKNFLVETNFYKKWIVPVANAEDCRKKMRLISKFENWVRSNHNFTAQLIEAYKREIKDRTALQSKNKSLKYKLENIQYALKLIRDESQNYISEVSRLRNEVDLLSRSRQISHFDTNEDVLSQLQDQLMREHNRANEILAWYRKEYEILPAWYKKFGHIVKVAMGKRTIKSLFK